MALQLLPLYKIGNPTQDLWQTQWKSILDIVLGKQIVDGVLLTNQVLKNGVNTINHKLGRKPVGWIIIDADAAVTPFRSQPWNEKTLTLTVGADVNICLWVF